MIVKRRIRVPETPLRGPGASQAALTWVGWLSALVAVGWIAWDLRVVLEVGEPRLGNWGSLLDQAWYHLPMALTIAMPAALEWGVPGARVRVPWLMRGVVLLALEQVASRLVLALPFWLLDPSTETFTALVSIVGFATGLLGVAGELALLIGLLRAGGSPDRRWLLLAAVAGAIASAAYLPVVAIATQGAGVDFSPTSLVLALVGTAMDAVVTATGFASAATLLVGWLGGARPRRAWALGAAAGAIRVILRATTLVTMLLTTGELPALVFSVLYLLVPLLLFLAFATGLGRGRTRREGPPRRIHRFEVAPAS